MPKQELPESDSDLATRVTVETRLRAVTEVNDGAPVGEVAERYGVTRQTITAWGTAPRTRRNRGLMFTPRESTKAGAVPSVLVRKCCTAGRHSG